MKARLTSEAINKLRARIRNKDMRIRIFRDINTLIGSVPTSTNIYGMMHANKWNGVLTTFGVLEYIGNELGMEQKQLIEIIDE